MAKKNKKGGFKKGGKRRGGGKSGDMSALLIGGVAGLAAGYVVENFLGSMLPNKLLRNGVKVALPALGVYMWKKDKMAAIAAAGGGVASTLLFNKKSLGATVAANQTTDLPAVSGAPAKEKIYQEVQMKKLPDGSFSAPEPAASKPAEKLEDFISGDDDINGDDISGDDFQVNGDDDQVSGDDDISGPLDDINGEELETL